MLCGCRAKFFVFLWERRALDKIRAKAAAREADAIRNARCKAAGGYTADNKNYFDTKAELDAWAAVQREHYEHFVKVLQVCGRVYVCVRA